MKTHVHIDECAFKRRCTGGLSKMELCLLCTVGLLVGLLVSVTLLWILIADGHKLFGSELFSALLNADSYSYALDRDAQHSQYQVCTNRECTRLAALFLGNMNEKVNPCDDFYEYACGNYGTGRDLAAGKPMRHTIIDTQSVLNKQVRQVLEAGPAPTDEPWDRITKDFYAKCMDEAEIDRRGITVIRSLLDQVGGWPLLESSWVEFGNRSEMYLADVLNKTAVSSILLELTVSHNPKNSSQTIIELDQPKFGVGSRWPYLDGINDTLMQNYSTLIVETAVRLGGDREAAEREVRELIEMEIRLVRHSADEADRGDPERGNNPFTLKQLRDVFPTLDLTGHIRRILEGFSPIMDDDIVVVREVAYFRGLEDVLRNASKRLVANYVAWRVLQSYSPFLPSPVRQVFYDFKANQTGLVNMPPQERWLDCVNMVVMLFDMPAGKLFVENFFDDEFALPKIQEMTRYFKGTFIQQLRELDWMDESTKQKAIRKSNLIEYRSGFPPEIFNQSWMSLNWNLPPTNSHEPVLNLALRVKQKRAVDELHKYHKPVDRSFWYQSPAQVDAFYAPNLNEMIFPAGIMQFPFLTSNVPNYATFAMVGAVIAHELTHAFCSQGSRYDEYGNLHDWWDRETATKYFDKADCFVRQYEEERIPELGGQRLNGKLSLGENIADNGGVKTAFRSYSTWKESRRRLEPALPGFQNMTSEQMFFIAYANNWCSMMHPQYAGQLLTGDVHAPARLRASIPLRNRPEFSRVFNCPPGSPMNPHKKCSLW